MKTLRNLIITGALYEDGSGPEAQIGDTLTLFLDTEANTAFPMSIVGTIQHPITRVQCNSATSYSILYNENDLLGSAPFLRVVDVVDAVSSSGLGVETAARIAADAVLQSNKAPLASPTFTGTVSVPVSGVPEPLVGNQNDKFFDINGYANHAIFAVVANSANTDFNDFFHSNSHNLSVSIDAYGVVEAAGFRAGNNNAGIINTDNGGFISTEDLGGSIDTSFNGGSINTDNSGGSIDTGDGGGRIATNSIGSAGLVTSGYTTSQGWPLAYDSTAEAMIPTDPATLPVQGNSLYIVGGKVTVDGTTGRLAVLAGSSSAKMAQVGGKLKEFFTNAGNVTTGETDLHLYNLEASLLGADGESIEAVFGGIFAGSASSKRLKVVIGGSVIFDSGALAVTSASSWIVKINLIRDYDGSARYMILLNIYGTASTAHTKVGVVGIGPSAFLHPQILKITGTASGTGAATNDIVSTIGIINWSPASI